MRRNTSVARIPLSDKEVKEKLRVLGGAKSELDQATTEVIGKLTNRNADFKHPDA